MVMPWEMSASHVQAGELGRLLIVDPSNGSEGRAVRILPGNSAQHSADSTHERVLDDQDLANATAIMLVPRMREGRADLVQSAAQMGGGQQGFMGVANGRLTGGGGTPRAGAPQRTWLHVCVQAPMHLDPLRGRPVGRALPF